mmetsp:Transcript_11921/g.18353  ORF Transcript_11921/g.18353 Transcript_11921/m.18353 type:complete len:468 (-) Transcript_11921:2010-3413(-)
MDFSSQLANLQRSATAAVAREEGQSRRPRSDSNELSYYGRPGRDRGGGRRRHNHNNNYHNNKRHRSFGPPGPFRNPKWNAIKHAIDSLPPYPPAAVKEGSNASQQFHLCLLAITIDKLHFEEIWKIWARHQQDQYSNLTISLIGHAKDPSCAELSPWFLSHLLVDPPRMGRGNQYAPPTYHSRRPQWGSIEITRAMLDLCHESLKIGNPVEREEADERFCINRYVMVDPEPAGEITGQKVTLPPVDAVLFISETCVPIANLTPDLLFGGKSIVNYRDTPNNGFSRQLQFDKIHSLVGNKKRKADQWMWLCRPHLLSIINDLPYNFWECFQDCNASDELFFPTSMAALGILPTDESNEPSTDGANKNSTKQETSGNDSPTCEASNTITATSDNNTENIRSDEQVLKRPITYADWSMSAKNPATFSTKKELQTIMELAQTEGFLVARKFTPDLTLEEWTEIVINHGESN